jgi:ABC-2 type transport system ATP-binding protein
MEYQIQVQSLTKFYRVPERDPGLKEALKSLARRRYREVHAVEDVSFSVQSGEMVGFIGPNGAGKTTTLKMLSGLLYPTSGEAWVNGFIPWERRAPFLKTIAMVMGNRNSLTWENTVLDSFQVLGEIYNVPRREFQQTLDDLVDLLELKEHLGKMARNLSLGERMKCEVAAALLHRPRVIFMDEPTLGLDVTMQIRLRSFIAEYNRRNAATIILTSHYMADVVTLCPRVILIQKGKLLFDGELRRLASLMAPFKLVRMDLGEGEGQVVEAALSDFSTDVVVLEHIGQHIVLRVHRDRTSAVTSRLLNQLPLVDITIEDPPIEAVIDQVYREGIDT